MIQALTDFFCTRSIVYRSVTSYLLSYVHASASITRSLLVYKPNLPCILGLRSPALQNLCFPTDYDGYETSRFPYGLASDYVVLDRLPLVSLGADTVDVWSVSYLAHTCPFTDDQPFLPDRQTAFTFPMLIVWRVCISFHVPPFS